MQSRTSDDSRTGHPPPMKPAAVIFDCDGVVVDSEPIAFDLLADDLAAHGLAMDRHAIEASFLGGTMRSVYQTARQKGARLPDDWVEVFYERLYARLAQGTPLVPGILGVLDALDAARIPFAMGSNGSLRKMEITLGQHPGLYERFAGRAFSGQAIGCPKPAPDLYLLAARTLNVTPAHCVVVEDSATGAKGAKAAGMGCFGYAPTGNASLHSAGAKLFTRMADLPGLLGL